MTKNLSGISIPRAAALASVPQRRIRELIRRKVIYAGRDSQGHFYVSEAVIGDLRRLCDEHFSQRGEFLFNETVGRNFIEPGFASRRFADIDGVKSIHYREIV